MLLVLISVRGCINLLILQKGEEFLGHMREKELVMTIYAPLSLLLLYVSL